VVVVWPSSWKREARGGGLGQKRETAKPRCRSLVSGAPCKTAAGDDAERWWDGVVVVVVVVWPSSWKCEARGGGLGQKRETELLRLGFGHAV